jgi:uncharacterized membrane protein (UPF0127 family)
MKIFLKMLILVFLIIILAYLFFYQTNILLAPESERNLQPEVCFNSRCILVEIVRKSAELEKGLMFRSYLGRNKGMLFVFEKEGIYPFWMKNTFIFLDIIWIDKNNKIVFIKKNAQPCLPAQIGEDIVCPLVDPRVDAKYVLEINTGV